MIKKRNKKKNTNKINRYGKKEFLFNLISIILVIILGLYIGFRSIYYYSKQTRKAKKEESTLAGLVLSSNKLTKRNNGLHQEEDGYVFKGIVDNNYVKFAGRIFRIIKVNNDNSVKVASLDSQAVLLYGDDSSYKESNLYNWLNKTNKENSGVYYRSIPGVEKLLKKTSWCKGKLSDNKVTCNNEKGEDYFSVLTLEDYIDTLAKNSYLNTKKNNWILGSGNNNSNLYVSNNGSVIEAENYQSFGVIVVFTFKKNIKVLSGSGSLPDPYIINTEGEDNNYFKYVKLGNDIWKVYEETGNTLRLSLNGYLKDGEDIFLTPYSNKNSIFNPLNKDNIAYYLNRTLYNSLSYKMSLAECNFYTGEVSFSNGLDYTNMYTESISNKIGLLNSFDINVNPDLTDYYLMDTTSSIGSMANVYKSDNTIEEVKVTEQKRIVPTICIDKSIIKSGSGSLDDPFIAG